MSISQSSTSNLLLQTLSKADFALLEPHFERIKLKQNDRIFEANRRIESVHFPEAGVFSVVALQAGGDMVEVGLYGREGMSGAAVVLAALQTPHTSMVQIDPASSLTITSDRLLEACRTSESLRNAMLRYVQSLSIQAELTAASNARDPLLDRLARWLLMCHDRVDGDQIELTHEFASIMLAVRRAGVTVTLHTLEATGSIRSTRGLVTIADRARLGEIAGSSYGGAEAEYRRLVGPFGKGGSPRSDSC